MSFASPAGSDAGSSGDAPGYARRRPEQTLLYRLVEEHYPVFKTQLAAQGSILPRHAAREFDDFLACGRLEHGFLRVACDGCRAEHPVAFSCKRRGFCPSCGARPRAPRPETEEQQERGDEDEFRHRRVALDAARQPIPADTAPSRPTTHLASRLKPPSRHRRAPEGHEGARRRPRPNPCSASRSSASTVPFDAIRRSLALLLTPAHRLRWPAWRAPCRSAACSMPRYAPTTAPRGQGQKPFIVPIPQGEHLKTVQQVLGHQSAATTTIYQDVPEEEMRRVLREAGESYDS